MILGLTPASEHRVTGYKWMDHDGGNPPTMRLTAQPKNQRLEVEMQLSNQKTVTMIWVFVHNMPKIYAQRRVAKKTTPSREP